jgi:adenylate cyclase
MTDTIRTDANAELLLRVSNRLAAMPTLDDQLNALIELTVEETGCERGTLFLNDSHTNELYSRVALGHDRREIRMPNTSGIAGSVFTDGTGLIIEDAYEDERFNSEIDELSGFETRNILSAPIRTVRGEVIGVAQCLNKKDGGFTQEDLELCEAMTMQASVVLQSTLFVLRTEKLRQQEAEFLQVVSDVSSEIQLVPLLNKIMAAVTKMLDAERSTLFLYDEKTDELYTEIGQGLGATSIRLPKDQGIAGAVFMNGKTINIPHAYADLRFSPAFDKKTGFFTRSILCVPVLNKDGRCIGVTQVLNKRGGAFGDEDEARLRAFTAQISIGIENAKLFHDVQEMKNYTENMFESMSNGVITFDVDGRLVRANSCALRIMGTELAYVEGRLGKELLAGANEWVMERLCRAQETRESDITMDAELKFNGSTHSVNLTALPLSGGNDEDLGSMLLIEDISTEKRVKSTMSRYMDPGLADQLLASGEEILGGKSHEATVLFTDIRGFTPLTEELGPQATVRLLNEYFTIMVDCISREGGMLDKFIGDAMLTVFGVPIQKEDDQDRAVRAGISMLTELTGYNRRRMANGSRPVHMGVGINTDIVVSGNIGSPRRMDYTVIGDGVNLASRLEGACKVYGAALLVSDMTFKRLRGTYRSREIDKVVVKGKTEPVSIHEILDYHTEKSFPEMVEVLGRFRDGLDCYREQDWDKALECFEEALAAHPGDSASQLYVKRCRQLRDDPPPADWDGVFKMTSK